MSNLLQNRIRDIQCRTVPNSPIIGTGGTMAVYASVMIVVKWLLCDLLKVETPEEVLVAIGVLVAGLLEYLRRRWRLFA